MTRPQLERTRDLMNAHVRDCLVTGYEPLIPTLNLPDLNDRHVLAAAVQAKASVIVTYNLSDFPAQTLAVYGITAQCPDAFLLRLLDLDENAVCAAIRRQRQSLRNPPKSTEELLETLALQTLPQTVSRLRLPLDLI